MSLFPQEHQRLQPMGDDLSDLDFSSQGHKVQFVPDTSCDASHLNSLFFAASAPLGGTSLASDLSLATTATGLEKSMFDHQDLYGPIVGSQGGGQSEVVGLRLGQAEDSAEVKFNLRYSLPYDRSEVHHNK